VLIRLSHKYPSMGYIQGFNYIAKKYVSNRVLIIRSCQIFVHFFVEQRNLGRIIMTNMSGIRRLSYVLKVYIFNYVPKVYKHLVKIISITLNIFVRVGLSHYFLKIYLWKLLINYGIYFQLKDGKIFIKFGIALLCAYQDEIISK
jgi:hypothetical protein